MRVNFIGKLIKVSIELQRYSLTAERNMAISIK